MRHYLITFIILALFLGCEDDSIAAGTSPVLALLPAEVTLSAGEDDHLALQLTGLDADVFGISLRISYNDAVVSFDDSTGFTLGDFFGPDIVSFVLVEASQIYLTLTRTKGQAGRSGSGSLAVLAFTGESAGVTSVAIQGAQLRLYDMSGDVIDIADLVVESALITVQ